MARDEPPRGFLARAATGRATLLELVVVAVFVAFGVHLVAASIPGVIGIGSRAAAGLGALICLLSISYLAVRLVGPTTYRRRLTGFLVFDSKSNELVDVPRYSPAEEVVDYMCAAFSENAALRAQWDKQPLSDLLSPESWKGEYPGRPQLSMALVAEALEYYVLHRLSTHLTDYFQEERFRKRNLREYERGDVPDVLLTNRFLELFSRPMEERAAFGAVDQLRIVREESGGESTVVSSIVLRGHKSEALYDRFDLVLPRKSRVSRLRDRCVEIDTARLVIRLGIRFEGNHTVLAPGFVRRYLGRTPGPETWVLEFGVDVGVSLKWAALVPGVGWEYHRWVDSFLDKLWREVDEDLYFQSIGWASALTVLENLDRTARPRTRAPRSSGGGSSGVDAVPPAGPE